MQRPIVLYQPRALDILGRYRAKIKNVPYRSETSATLDVSRTRSTDLWQSDSRMAIRQIARCETT